MSPIFSLSFYHSNKLFNVDKILGLYSTLDLSELFDQELSLNPILDLNKLLIHLIWIVRYLLLNVRIQYHRNVGCQQLSLIVMAKSNTKISSLSSQYKDKQWTIVLLQYHTLLEVYTLRIHTYTMYHISSFTHTFNRLDSQRHHIDQVYIQILKIQ